MKRNRNIAVKVILTCIVTVFIVLIFAVFSHTNRERIVRQNARYVEDSALQTVKHIDTILDDAQRSIELVAELYSGTLTSEQMNLEALGQFAGKTPFASVEFVDTKGIAYTMKEEKADVSNQFYFKDGVKGNSGMAVVLDSPVAKENLLVFYAPIKYKEKIIGILIGHYQEKDISDMLNTTFFGEDSNTYLCLQDGRIIASSGYEKYTGNIIKAYQNSGKFETSDISQLEKSFQNLDSSLIYYEGSNGPGVAYVTRMICVDWMLVQSFPSKVTDNMLQNASAAGIHLEIELLVIFAGYILFLLLQAGKDKKVLLWEKDVKLQYNEQLFSLMTSNTDDIFILFSAETYKADYVSPNIKRVLGISAKLIREDVRKLLLSAVDEELTLNIESLRQLAEGDFWETEREMVHRTSGERRWYRERLYHVMIEDTEKYVMILSDRTAERQVNQTLEQALNAATSANQAKSSFLANMSHDIRTPMNAIVGFSMLLTKEAEQPDKVREYTRKITASSQHLLSLINDILDMSKIESGKTSLNVGEFHLPELLEDIKTIILPQAKAKGHIFEIKVTGEPPEILLGDKLRINQILLNILSNAIKYTPTGGQIELSVENLKRLSPNYARLCFRISDNGIGMSAEYLKTIFEPFTRETGSAAGGIQGTGLGMAITKNLVSLMGGTIEVQSKLNQGSVFTVNMEFSIPEQLRDEHFWERYGISRVLVVDDEEDVCHQIQSLMDGTGVVISYATSGGEAIDVVKKKHDIEEDYHVILLDWKMPDMDGIETARRIRRIVGKDVTILVLTAYDWSGIEEEAKASGIDMFLSKPFFVSSFQQALMQNKINDTGEAVTLDSETEEKSMEGMLFLVAEDNELNAEILTEMLDMEGARCELAVNGEEALEKFSKSVPGYYDMILMDVQMPVMNGYEATRAIRACGHEDAGEIPIVAMTANAFAQDVHDAMEAGMNAHVAKPVDMEILRNTLQTVKRKQGDGVSENK